LRAYNQTQVNIEARFYMTEIQQPQANRSVRLICCHPNVDPAVVSKILGIEPSYALKVGEIGIYPWNGEKFQSGVGKWELVHPDDLTKVTIEDAIERWLPVLEKSADAFRELHKAGYRPYLDCRALAADLSLCIDPEILVRLGQLQISLSVWLYEAYVPDR
jgi:hypothetical protein